MTDLFVYTATRSLLTESFTWSSTIATRGHAIKTTEPLLKASTGNTLFPKPPVGRIALLLPRHLRKPVTSLVSVLNPWIYM